MDRSTTDRLALERAKRETLSRVHAARERVTSQLDAASWSVQEATTAAIAGSMPRAREELEGAATALRAAVGDDHALAPLRAALEGGAGG